MQFEKENEERKQIESDNIQYKQKINMLLEEVDRLN